MPSVNQILLALCLCLGLGLSPQAMAHKVNLFAYAEGMTVFVEGYFVDGKAAQNSTVQVFDADEQLVAEGVTDDDGQYEFSLKDVSDLKVVLNAGMGHQATFSLSSTELGLGGSDENVTSQDSDVAPEATESAAQNAAAPTIASADLEALVYKAVNEANKPLVRELAASQEKASLSGIVGGIGYIVGFLGLFAYFKARQMIKEAA